MTRALDGGAVLAAADFLAHLRRHPQIVDDIPEPFRPATLDDGYRVQAALIDRLLPPGSRCVGFKVACTNRIAQQALAIDRPLFGRLLAHAVHGDGAVLTAADFTHRVIESEFAFRIGRDVPRRPDGHSVDTVADCIDAVVPAIEIVDHRFVSWTVGAPQVAADNAIHGCWVRGRALTDWRDLDLAGAAVRVCRNGALTSTGSGSAVLGHPLEVMRFLADELPRFGLDLRAGDLVTTGVTTDVFEADAGDSLVAEFDGVGTVAVNFV
ncbi:MAG: fumarylacetoacetate hydrolase family protein [Thermoleophilia bacterium]|nr:fumarylacetoacetate hydrolase family protein [Thermoleophilia bacterium]